VFRRFLVLRKRWHLVILLIFLAMISAMISACEEESLPAFTSLPPSPITPTIVITSPPPTPQTTVTFPTSQPGMGTVQGVLARGMGGDLYLAKLLPDDEFPLFELEMEVSPKAIMSEMGEFIFINVPPGRYGLVFWTPLNSSLINDPRTDTTLVISVEADKPINMGEIDFSP
jgi:hypothetical protein